MTTYFNFQPSITAAYQFQPVLDGVQYVATVQWNLAGQRWYLSLDDNSGNNIFLLPLIGSPVGASISTAVYDELAQQVDITTAEPHGYALGQTIELTVSGMTPAAYNGTFQCFITGGSSIVFNLSGNPGAATALGVLSFNINLADGYFTTSTLVWREANGTFEVSP